MPKAFNPAAWSDSPSVVVIEPQHPGRRRVAASMLDLEGITMKHNPNGWRRWTLRPAMACAEALARLRCLIVGGELIRDEEEADDGGRVVSRPAVYALATVPGGRVDLWGLRDDLEGTAGVCLDALGWRVEAWCHRPVHQPALP